MKSLKHISKYVPVLLLLLLISCDDSSVEPIINHKNEQGMFLKQIDTSLFQNDIGGYLITARTDTIFDSGGVYRIMQLPNITLFLKDSAIAFNEFVGLSVSHDGNSYVENVSGWYAGSYIFSTRQFFYYKIKSDTAKSIYIRMEGVYSKKEYFKVGIRYKSD